jgi:predicted DNA-binding protein with PD1-like motif
VQSYKLQITATGYVSAADLRFAQTNFRTSFLIERKRPLEVISEELHETPLTTTN